MCASLSAGVCGELPSLLRLLLRGLLRRRRRRRGCCCFMQGRLRTKFNII